MIMFRHSDERFEKGCGGLDSLRRHDQLKVCATKTMRRMADSNLVSKRPKQSRAETHKADRLAKRQHVMGHTAPSGSPYMSH